MKGQLIFRIFLYLFVYIKIFYMKDFIIRSTSFVVIFVVVAVVYNRLIENLYSNNLLNAQQFGYRKSLSTEDVIFRLTHEILNALTF